MNACYSNQIMNTVNCNKLMDTNMKRLHGATEEESDRRNGKGCRCCLNIFSLSQWRRSYWIFLTLKTKKIKKILIFSLCIANKNFSIFWVPKKVKNGKCRIFLCRLFFELHIRFLQIVTHKKSFLRSLPFFEHKFCCSCGACAQG